MDMEGGLSTNVNLKEKKIAVAEGRGVRRTTSDTGSDSHPPSCGNTHHIVQVTRP